MILDNLNKIYDESRKDFYRRVFTKRDRKAPNVTAADALCAEVIFYMGKPTLTEFAEYLNISPPNATYKVKQLVMKGYVKKEDCSEDRRQTYLMVTQKYLDDFRTNLITARVNKAINEVAEREDLVSIEKVLSDVCKHINE